MSRTRKDDALIVRQIDGLASPAEREALKERMRHDAEVRRAVERTEAIVEAIAATPAEEPPFDLVAAAMRKAAAPAAAERKLSLGPWLLAPLAAAAAAVLVLVVVRPEPPPAVRAPELLATAVDGTVWVEEAGARRRTAAGERLGAGARLVSEADGALTLTSSGGSGSVLVREGTVARLVAEGQSLAVALEHGIVRVESTSAEAPLFVQLGGFEGRRVEVRAAAAGVLADGDGGFTVASERGEAHVYTASAVVRVAEGSELVGRDAASRVRPRARELGLELVPVGPVPARQQKVALHGKTAPGVLLTIDGVRVAVAEDGSFTHEVAFAGRPVQVSVSVRDALARRREALVALAPVAEPRQRAPKAPGLRGIETEWEWEGKTRGG